MARLANDSGDESAPKTVSTPRRTYTCKCKSPSDSKREMTHLQPFLVLVQPLVLALVTIGKRPGRERSTHMGALQRTFTLQSTGPYGACVSSESSANLSFGQNSNASGAIPMPVKVS
jgi:hypothetical protein